MEFPKWKLWLKGILQCWPAYIIKYMRSAIKIEKAAISDSFL